MQNLNNGWTLTNECPHYFIKNLGDFIKLEMVDCYLVDIIYL